MPYTTYTFNNGTNFIPFDGVINTNYNQTFVNPYSGYTITLTGTKNVNNAIYDGRGGTDTLSMTSLGDVLTLTDSAGTVMVKNVEIFQAGADGDAVILADATQTYGNVQIRGADGDDLLWSNAGDDLIYGATGNDILDGGAGSDLLFGGDDDDYVSGGLGADSVFGGAGDDTLVYTADGIWSGNYTLASLGSAIPFAAMINLNGMNQSYDTFNGDADEARAVGARGTDTLVMTSGNDVLVISDTISPSSNFFYPRVAEVEIIEAGDGNDIVDMSGEPSIAVTIHGGNGDDILAGSNGNDTITGDAGNDRLFGSTGDDTLSGGTDNDTYYYRAGDGNDTIIETSGTDGIVFGPGITLASLSFQTVGTDLKITVGTDTITIQNQFAADLSGRVENLTFADNSTYNLGTYGPPAAPVANADHISGNEDEIITGNVLANDTDANGDTVTVTAQNFTTANGGSVVLNTDGSFTYQGAENFNGADGFTYTVTDGNGHSTLGNVDLDVHSVNDDPVANDDFLSGNEDEIVTGSLLDNDTDVEGDALTAVAETVTTINGGSVTINADGTFSYTGANNFNGTDYFHYNLQDAAGGSAVGTVLLEIGSINDQPVAYDDAFNGLRNATLAGNVLTNDVDTDGPSLYVHADTIMTAHGGTVLMNSDGTFTYDGPDGFYGEDTFEYSLLDGDGGFDTGNVTLTIALDPAHSIIGTDTGETINGTAGNDEIFAQGGDDTVKGQGGDDTIFGGQGNDILYGDDSILTGTTHDKSFADTILMPELREGVNITNLRPKGDPALGINAGNLSVDYDATATVTFRKGYAGYDNSFGVFGVAADGTIVQSTMEWANVKTAGIDTAHTIDLPVGAAGGSFGFFIIADGNNANAGYSGLNITGEGSIKFIYNYGQAGQRDAKITDAGNKITAIYTDGHTTKVLSGDVYFTTDRGASTALNEDGKTHVVSGLLDTNNLILDPKAADLASKPVSITKDDITVSALGGTLIGHGDSIGVKTSASGDTVSGSEGIHVGFAHGADKVTVSLSDIAGNGTGIDFKIYLDGDTTHPVSYEYVIGAISGGKLDIVLNGSDFGGHITGFDISSFTNSTHGNETFYFDNVLAEIPGGTDTNTLRIGFEDLYNTGDADYEDVLFDLDINPTTLGDSTGGNDYLDGGANNDTLYGEGGKDILVIGLGLDHATGGMGADTFALKNIDTNVDVIHDFHRGEGDVINLSDVLEGYDPLHDDISAFVHLVQNGADTQIQINADGDTGGAFVTAALILGGVGGESLAALVSEGAIVANQSVTHA